MKLNQIRNIKEFHRVKDLEKISSTASNCVRRSVAPLRRAERG